MEVLNLSVTVPFFLSFSFFPGTLYKTQKEKLKYCFSVDCDYKLIQIEITQMGEFF